MPQNKLHIVSFDVPYPPDYGGAIDVFYKIKALKKAGCTIYLHCYEYGRSRSVELEQLCEQVWYYPRTRSGAFSSFLLPYIVSSRMSAEMLQRLQEIDAPILFEGVHTSAFLSHSSLQDRFKAIRVHNIEHDYFRLLSVAETGTAKKMIYKAEAFRLKKYEYRLADAQAFLALSLEDHKFFKKLYPAARHAFVPPFHPYSKVTIKEGCGDYALYHGNLSHPENRAAVTFLLTEVIPFIKLPFIIAGKKPGEDIIDLVAGLHHCTLIADPDAATMSELMTNAQVHVLPTFQQSGMKLKLLSALFSGRHVIVNKAMLHGTGMTDNICAIASNAQEFISAIERLFSIPFTDEHIAQRSLLLSPYSNSTNALKLMEHIF